MSDFLKKYQIPLTLLTVIAITGLIFWNIIWVSKKTSFPQPVEVVKRSQATPKTVAAKRISTTTLSAPSTTLSKTPKAGLSALKNSEFGNQPLEGFFNLTRASREDVDRNLQIADAAIEKTPDVYAAHKAKLLSLLLKELRFKQTIDGAEYDRLYDDLLRFRGTDERDEVLQDLRAYEQQVSPEAASEIPPATELSGIDHDLVQIPFLRLKALGDFQDLAQMAQDYIEVFPDSYVGYLYLADAAWNLGDKVSAITLFKRALGGQTSDEAAYDLINRFDARSAVDVISKMSLE